MTPPPKLVSLDSPEKDALIDALLGRIDALVAEITALRTRVTELEAILRKFAIGLYFGHPGRTVVGALPVRTACGSPRSYEGEWRPGIEYPWSIAHPRRLEDDTAWKARARVRRSGLR
jgi:hypothetical protein